MHSVAFYNTCLLWISRWLEKQGLRHIAEVLEQKAADDNHVAALHARARRALAAGRTEQALMDLHAALARVPDDAALWCSLGAAYRRAANFPESRAAYEKALEYRPAYPEALNNLGEWHLTQGDPELALQWLKRALTINGDFLQAKINTVAALFELGQVEVAREEAEAIVEASPDCPEAYVNLGNILVHAGKAKQGIKNYQKALELRPGYEEAHFNLATLVGAREDLPKAIGYLERQILERGESVQRLGLLAAAHQAAGSLTKSEALCRKILEAQPKNVTALVTLASCISTSGDAAAALRIYQDAVTACPESAAIESNVLFEMNNLPDFDRAEIFFRHQAWAKKHVLSPVPAGNLMEKKSGKLRIGYVSGDFCGHPVGFLFRDVLRHHDSSRFEIHVFSMLFRPDDITQDIRAACDSWLDVFLLTDDELEEAIRAAGIDILIDLSGHTALNRLPVFSRRPAPIQATWIGYFHSTGLSEIDYFISDPYTSPPDSGQLFSEKLINLPDTRFCYSPPAYAPDIAPRTDPERITFGSFNRLAKLNDQVLQTWARILHAVPDSCLVIKAGALADTGVKARFLERCQRFGLPVERLELRPGSPHSVMLDEYNEIDLALDSFPFNGGMTTFEALWMGVPVLTIEGDTVVSRQSYSILANMGLVDMLVVNSVDAYVQRAIELAAQKSVLCGQRPELRKKMLASPLCQPLEFTQNLEKAFTSMLAAASNELPSVTGKKG